MHLLQLQSLVICVYDSQNNNNNNKIKVICMSISYLTIFFLAYLLNIRLTKLRISFLLFKKKKTDFRAFKKKLDKKKYIHFAK